MRPVDLLPGTVPAFFNNSFDLTTGASMLKIGDYKEEIAKRTKAEKPNRIYTYFRNRRTFNGESGPTLPPAGAGLPAQSPPRVLVPPTAARVLVLAGIRNRDNTADISLHAQVLGVQVPVTTRRVRLVLPIDEGSDLVSAWHDGDWNGGAPDAIPDRVQKAVWKIISKTDTVPEDPPEPGARYYGYRGAINDLEATLGGYCSYCETKRSGADTHDVEHRLAKASYHSDILLWTNYLLGCKMCNQYSKRENPDREFGIRNAITAFHSGANAPPSQIRYPLKPPNPKPNTQPDPNISPLIPPSTTARVPYSEMRRACQLYHLWPSLDDGGTPNAPMGANAANPINHSLITMKYRMYEYTIVNNKAQQGNPVPDADAIHPRNGNYVDGPRNTVQADIWDSSLAPARIRRRYVRVLAEPSSPQTTDATFNARKLQAAQNTATMVKLNTPIKARGDRRIVERTRAWLEATEAVYGLRRMLTFINTKNAQVAHLFPGGNPINTAWKPVLDGAERGYYSVWVTVFRKFSVANPGPGSNLAQALVDRLNNRANHDTIYRYRGTNLGRSVSGLLTRL